MTFTNQILLHDGRELPIFLFEVSAALFGDVALPRAAMVALEFAPRLAPAARSEAISEPLALAVVERAKTRYAAAERRLAYAPPTCAALAKAADVTIQVARTWVERWDAVPPRCARALERAANGRAA